MLLSNIDDHIDAAEVVCRFNYIVHVENFIFYANIIGFKKHIWSDRES